MGLLFEVLGNRHGSFAIALTLPSLPFKRSQNNAPPYFYVQKKSPAGEPETIGVSVRYNYEQKKTCCRVSAAGSG
jgi:hypothetical protein